MVRAIHVVREHDGHVYQDQWHIYCLGCKHIHAMSPKIHTFNGDFLNPTFNPSLLQNFVPGQTCHSWVRDGKMEFLNDSYHELAGQTVELPLLFRIDDRIRLKDIQTEIINADGTWNLICKYPDDPMSKADDIYELDMKRTILTADENVIVLV
jgi:hypothetical protein